MDSAIVKHSPILWIEGRWPGSQDFVSLLRKKGFLIETTSTGRKAIAMAAGNKYDLLIVNAASMRTSGARIVKSVYERYPDLPIVLICDAERTAVGVEEYVGYVLVLDFTTRKLVNRIMKLLPGDEKKMIHQGPIVVDLDRSMVSCFDQRTTLTPRLMALLMLFIENAGEVITRETLFKKVWKTSYTGDTRTLDVHISWLRRAIEFDPRNPEILVTIRGVGYKLNV